MFATLTNEYLSVSVKETGAELTSIRSILHDVEYLWQASVDVWPRHAPVLFPIVGKLKNNQYTHNGSIYSLSQHGFARDKIFYLKDHSNAYLKYVLEYDEETLKVYPFFFRLEICYHLIGCCVHVEYNIVNLDTEQDMFFSIGGHPAFRWPLFDNDDEHSYYLEFNKTTSLKTQCISQGMRNGEIRPIELVNNILPLNKKLFENDALVLSDLGCDSVAFKCHHHKHGVIVNFKGFPYLGIWSKPGPFLCIEPWHGIADHQQHNGELKNKEGIQLLKPHQTFTCRYTLEFH
ncbi:MAG: aldose 1-epimerase family protein [Cytophagaceae bacterium]|nr:aldose 1-epimerase family protein [Cytophagaceae bacterium]MDW8457329.1 aldose 1-epimerase family protein [Cytophagaceae bacterium]